MQKLKVRLFLYVKEIIDEQKKGFFPLFLKAFLYIVSLFISFYVFLKNFFYDKGIFKQKKFKPFVISIGNIVAGGTGKTPFTIFLAKKLMSKYKVGIISRGYKSKFENKNIIIEKKDLFSAKEIGDEPMMMRNKLKEATFFIGKDRIQSLKNAESMNLDIVLLDDAFQNRKFKKDLEIVVLDANNLFGKNYFLPRGYLRESTKNLKRADLIIVNNVANGVSQIKNLSEIKKYSKAKVVLSNPKGSKICDLKRKEAFIEKKSKIAIFCSIANPDYFHKTLKEMGYEIVHSLHLLDHEKISNKQLNDFIKESIAKGAKYILTTQKDSVKIDSNLKFEMDIYYLEINLEILSGQSQINAILEKNRRNV